MKNLKKKGFTIVELVIVIAVIAVLAAVLIPTFSNLIDKANEASKTQLVRNLNVALATNIEGHKTMHDALETVEDKGYVVEKLTPTEDGLVILYDITQDRFILVDNKGKEVYPKDGKTSSNKYDLWKIADSYDQQTEYSVYLTDAFTGTTLEVSTGVDVGNNPVTQVTYTGANNVTIRTLGNCQFNVTGTGTVDHYGEALIELGNTHNCHADVYQQGNDNQVGLDKGFAGGNGSESQPYLITTNEHWEAVGSVADENAYFEILTDIVLDENSSAIANATGHIDFNRHSITVEETYPEDIYGNSYLFHTGENLTVSNLSVHLNRLTSIIGYAKNNVHLENISTYGDVEANSNNDSAFICFTEDSQDADYIYISFVNCNNYVNILNQNGYAGAFIGSLHLTTTQEVRINMKDCNNYGSILSYAHGASMLIGNPTATKFEHKIHLDNVRNYGVIMGKTGGGLVTTNVGRKDVASYYECTETRKLSFYSDENFATLIVDNENNRVKLSDDYTPNVIDIKNAGSGITSKYNSNNLTVKDDNTFDLSSIVSDDAKFYIVSFTFNGFGKMNGAAGNYQFKINAEDIDNAIIYAYEWINYFVPESDKDKLHLPEVNGNVEEHNEYGLTYYTCGNNYVFKLEGSYLQKQPLVIAYAINAEGEHFNLSVYNYTNK